MLEDIKIRLTVENINYIKSNNLTFTFVINRLIDEMKTNKEIEEKIISLSKLKK